MQNTHNADTKAGNLTEEQLVLLAQNGDASALERVFSDCEWMVRARSKSYFLAGGEREDIIQEGMIGLYKAVRDFNADRGVSFRSFADVCITRQILTAVKTATRFKHVPLNSYVSLNGPAGDGDDEREIMDIWGPDESSDPEKLFIGREDYRMLRSVIVRELSPLEREVFDLYCCGDSYGAIAAKLSKSVKSVDNAIQRIRKKLFRRLMRLHETGD